MTPLVQEELDSEGFLNLKQALAKAGTMDLRVKGKSMIPVLAEGELITVERCPIQDIKRFDIVVFVRNGGLICHYFWRMDRDLANADEKFVICRSTHFRKVLDVVKESDFLGRVTSHRLNAFNKLKALVF